MPRLRPTEALRWVAIVGALATLSGVLTGAAAGRGGVERRAGTIAFLRYPPGALVANVGGPSLFVIKADGTGLRRLTSAESSVYGYAWSPDRSRIAYTDRGVLWLVRPDGTRRRRLFSRPGERCSVPTWTPDGKAIAVDAVEAKNPATGYAHLYVVPTDGTAARRFGPDDLRDPSWSPRGDKVAYASPRGIWVARSNLSHERLVVPRPFGGPKWSADGRRLAFVGGDANGRYASIYVANADGSNLRRLTKHAYNEYGFVWSPAGRKILYGKEDRQGIYVIGADERNDRRITTDSPPQVAWGALTWSPDGRSVAYVTDRTGGGDIYLIDADGRNKTRLTRSPEIDSDPSWAPG